MSTPPPPRATHLVDRLSVCDKPSGNRGGEREEAPQRSLPVGGNYDISHVPGLATAGEGGDAAVDARPLEEAARRAVRQRHRLRHHEGLDSSSGSRRLTRRG